MLETPCELAASGEPMFLVNGFYTENRAFCDAIRRGERPPGDLRDARQSVAVMQALRERQAEYAVPARY
jgi:predicted dehydrogenase